MGSILYLLSIVAGTIIIVVAAAFLVVLGFKLVDTFWNM
jgi:hypothetical protein